MTRSAWSVAQLAAYLQGLVDADMGLASIFVQHFDDDDSQSDAGLLIEAKFRRNDDDNPNDPGILTLRYGEL